MAVFNLFSKNQKRLREMPSDILSYDQLPNTLRVQIIHILRDGFGVQILSYGNDVEEGYKAVHDILCREYGLFELNNHRCYEEKVVNYILSEADIERVLDAVDLGMTFITNGIPKMYNYKNHTIRKIDGEEAIKELNVRFKEHAIGFQYEQGSIIRVDSMYIHAEIVKPTLNLLTNQEFSGASEEYLKAHEHYRHGRNKECITECLKAFESMMKTICQLKGWAFNNNDTAKTLINICISSGLFPTYLQTQIGSLRTLLESGVPTVRNRVGGHGQGAIPVIVTDETTRYALNLTGANIIYLIELSGV